MGLAGKKMKLTIEKLEEELRQWRSGQTVDQSEQIQLGAGVMEESMTSAPSLQQLNKPTADFDLTRSHISQVSKSSFFNNRMVGAPLALGAFKAGS